MNILATDTCTMTATAALLTDDRLAAQTVQNNKKTHSQNIMPMIDAMLKTADISINDIDCFAAAVGPGSFTGVRIGVATVKALAHGTGKPCTAVSALHALAFNLADFDGIICPIMDARRGQVYNALFKGTNACTHTDTTDIIRLTDDRALSAEELLTELDTLLKTKEYITKNAIFVGDGVPVFADLIKERLNNRALFARRNTRMSLAASVAEIAYLNVLNGDVCAPSELTPLYLRLSQAERERREKLKQESINV